MSIDDRLVWFRLYDLASGLPYQGTSADAVLLPVGSFVVQFRDKVKDKFNHPGFLKDIPSGILLVYRNKTAFEKRNLDEGKEGLLDPSDYLGNLGSKDDMLVVVVPSDNARFSDWKSKILKFPVASPSTGRVPAVFRSMRMIAVESIYKLLFPVQGDPLRFLHVRAPPMSGKSALCDLLHNYILERHHNEFPVFRILANESSWSSVVEIFAHWCDGMKISDFFNRTSKGVLLIDEGQITYDDVRFWTGELKNTIECVYPGVRVVVFSAYGSFDRLRKAALWQRPGIPIQIPEAFVFRLYPTVDKPGLLLLREELDEMASAFFSEKVTDLIWDMSSGHIGIAHAIISFLVERLKLKENSATVADDVIVKGLYSLDLVKRVKTYRGIPHLEAFEGLSRDNHVLPETVAKLQMYLNQVAAGVDVMVKCPSRSPASNHAIELLTLNGFLHEDPEGILHFASDMHRLVWLQSNRTDPGR